MAKSRAHKSFIKAVRLERERDLQAKAADIARSLNKSREAVRQALIELGLPTRLNGAKVCIACGKKLSRGNRTGRCLGCFTDPEVKDAIVRDYLRGDKPAVIQLVHKVGPAVMYRILHTRGVKLRRK